MDVKSILVDLRSELNRIEAAILALERLDGSSSPAGGTAFTFGANVAKQKGGRRKLSAAARKRIGDAARVRWAKIKGKGASAPAAAKAPAKAAKPKRRISAAGRARIAAAARERWAKLRAARGKR